MQDVEVMIGSREAEEASMRLFVIFKSLDKFI